jgi:VCBS repeat-containing protein
MTDPIVKNFVTDFGAVGDGVTDDLPAVYRWLAWAKTQGTAPVELYMPPLVYHFAGYGTLTDGLYNVTISGYGATVDSLHIGTLQLQNDFDHSARIETVSAGATSLNLITPADAAKFSVGQWILVSGLSLQAYGWPPNWQFFEYKQITDISGSVVTLADPLDYSYKSTWPVVSQDLVQNLGGPATIFALGPTFDAEQKILGLEVTADVDGGAVTMQASRSLILDGMKFDGFGPAPSFGQSIIIRNSDIGTGNEVDKLVSNLEYDNVTGSIVTQSASITNLVIKDSTLDQLVGTAQNTTIEHSTIREMMAGPLFFGAGESISIVDSNVSTIQMADQAFDLRFNPSLLSFDNGTFRVANASPHAADVYRWAVPGHEYFFGFYFGGFAIIDDTGHSTTFKITDMWQDATYTYIDTDLGAALPTPTFFGGRPFNQFVSFPAMVVTQVNSGPADAVTSIWTPGPTVTPVNDAPVAVDDSYITNEETTFTVAAAGVLANDSDMDSAVSLVSGPAHGTVTLNADGAFSYTPAANYNGADSFTYKANDGQADSNVATVSLTVTPVNDAPVAVDDSYITNEDTTFTVAAASVLANDSDVDSAALTVSLVSGPAHGTVTLNADGAFSYTPAANYNGADSFTYKANDGQADSNVATVSLTVTPVNDAPVANDDLAGGAKGRAIKADAQHGVLVNDGDLDGDGLSVSAVNGAGANVGQTVVGTYGSLTINIDGSYSYVANKGHLPPQIVAQDSFTYTASDGHGGTSTATLTVTITKPNAVYLPGTHGNDMLTAGNGPMVLDPASPPGAEHAAQQAHVPTTLPPEHDDTLVFTSITDTRTLPEQALTNAAEHAHLPTELPAVQSHDVTLPGAATGHMPDVAVGHHPEWFHL